MVQNPLQKELDYFKAHQAEISLEYKGKFVVIKDQQVQGAFSSEFEALTTAQEKFELGTFLIQQALPGEDIYTETLHRVFVV